MKKTRAFIGLSGPIGYNYERLGKRRSTPNPILEDVTGLLLCYDELIFLCRELCPQDMRDLPYVSFVTEDSVQADRALVAAEQSKEIYKSLRHEPADLSGLWASTLNLMVGELRGIDNHGRPLLEYDTLPTPNCASAENAVVDRIVAQSLDLGELDILVNSCASKMLNGINTDLIDNPNFAPWHLDVASKIAGIRVPNSLGLDGGYNEAIEDVRSHQYVADFRRHLLGRNPEEVPVDAMVDSINDLAATYAQEAFRKDLSKGRTYASVGKMLTGSLLSFLPGPAGTLASLTCEIPSIIVDSRRRKASRWAGFVVDINSKDFV